MALYFVSYDLRKSRDYDKIYDKLDEFNAVRIVESTWCFKRFNTSAGDLRDFFKSYIDSDDCVVVSEVDPSKWASYNAEGTPNDL